MSECLLFILISNCHKCPSNVEQYMYLMTIDVIKRLRISKATKIKLYRNAFYMLKFCQEGFLIKHNRRRHTACLSQRT